MCWFYWSIKSPPKQLWGMLISCNMWQTSEQPTSSVFSENGRAGWEACVISVSFKMPITRIKLGTPDLTHYRHPEKRQNCSNYAVHRGATGCIWQSGVRHWKMWVVARLLLPCDIGSGNCADQLHKKTSYLKPLLHRVLFQYLGPRKRKKSPQNCIAANARGKIAN